MPIVVEGLDKHLKDLTKMKRRALNVAPMTSKGMILMLTNRWPKRWRAQKDVDGASWRPLKKKTEVRKGSTRILFDAGTLQKSVQISGLNKADSDSITIGTNLIYAAPHQFGMNKAVAVKEHERKNPVRKSTKRKVRRKKFVTVKAHSFKNKKGKIVKVKRHRKKLPEIKAKRAPSFTAGTGTHKVKAHVTNQRIRKRSFLGFSREDLITLDNMLDNYIRFGKPFIKKPPA